MNEENIRLGEGWNEEKIRIDMAKWRQCKDRQRPKEEKTMPEEGRKIRLGRRR